MQILNPNPKPPTMAEAKRAAIVAALRYYRGDKDAAAEALAIGRATLYRNVAELEIIPEEYTPGVRVMQAGGIS